MVRERERERERERTKHILLGAFLSEFFYFVLESEPIAIFDIIKLRGYV